MSAELFQYGADIGLHFSLLDIGGGFPGTKDSTDLFAKVTSAINQSLQTLFSKLSYPRLTIIAEPGMHIQWNHQMKRTLWRQILTFFPL